jgi:hypothetical protein
MVSIPPSRLMPFTDALASVGLSTDAAAEAMGLMADALSFTLERPSASPLLADANLTAEALRERLTADPGRAVLRVLQAANGAAARRFAILAGMFGPGLLSSAERLAAAIDLAGAATMRPA